ncbi:hypothetical protein AB0L00_44405 [Actinoallomurus sp. NPDC052308]|uniref:hypothetical protein n=1 Tax=Actinoallomurus sp. NPDC052308 TaxID=3155530 RepID=UPI00343EA5F6
MENHDNTPDRTQRVIKVANGTLVLFVILVGVLTGGPLLLFGGDVEGAATVSVVFMIAVMLVFAFFEALNSRG